MVTDATDSWTYSVDATWRAMNTSSNNRIDFMIGVDESLVEFEVHLLGSNNGSNAFGVGIGLDKTSGNAR